MGTIPKPQRLDQLKTENEKLEKRVKELEARQKAQQRAPKEDVKIHIDGKEALSINRKKDDNTFEVTLKKDFVGRLGEILARKFGLKIES